MAYADILRKARPSFTDVADLLENNWAAAGQLDNTTATAAGSSQGDATALSGAIHYNVSGADNAKGVKLPAAAAGTIVSVFNADTSSHLLVYPNSSDAIGVLAADLNVILAPEQGAYFIANDATTWNATFGDSGWYSYTPTYTGSGTLTYTSVTTTSAIYRVQGAMVDLFLHCTGTVGGSGSEIRVSTPTALDIANADGTQYLGTGWTNEGSTNQAAHIFKHNATNFRIFTGDLTNWAAGSAQISLNLRYQLF